MININTAYTDIAKEKHWASLENLLKKRLKSISLPNNIKEYIGKHLEEIIIAPPHKLIKINNDFINKIRSGDKTIYDKNSRKYLNTMLLMIKNWNIMPIT